MTNEFLLEFARDCAEAQCSNDERCVVYHVACDEDQREGKPCGTGFKCVENGMSAGMSRDLSVSSSSMHLSDPFQISN